MMGTFHQGRSAPYTPFFTPPFNEAEVLKLGRPVGHIDSDVLRLRGYSIESVDGTPDLIDAAYCPRQWQEFLPHVSSSSVRTGFVPDGSHSDERERRARVQLLAHATAHICNTHPSWEPMTGRAGFLAEREELSDALLATPVFAALILLGGKPIEVQMFDHLGERFALLPPLEHSLIVTIAGPPETFDSTFSLRLPSPE
ncbi:hypothetical protein B7R25_04025 [Subtercola boreus]|uniref:Uncharacterized protein n=2 Tax=Subtercola boreus TaxID=120213 RepID=A0A3E0WGF2_9MICO|nr:hypothetical protein B7R24_04015 [Subtercola boreus]RFA23130.1 hypothetical protein B7R23_04010 [Subtercola boreus]RFA28883.1 hypothetical protein B7R25_04025 [Subtercola boreus]